MGVLTEITELTTTILTGVLLSIIFSALILLFLLIHMKFTGRHWKNSSDNKCNKDIKLLKPAASQMHSEFSNDSLNDGLVESYQAAWNENGNSSDIDHNVSNEHLSDVITHYMEVLSNCRLITERLTEAAINRLDEWDPNLKKLVDAAMIISVRVDQLVHALQLPINSIDLQSRAAALTLAVTNFAIMTQYDCKITDIPPEWISKMLIDIQKHIDVLKKPAYFNQEEY